jgi:hypothetical protein
MVAPDPTDFRAVRRGEVDEAHASEGVEVARGE